MNGTQKQIIKALKELSGEPLAEKDRAYAALRRSGWQALSDGAKADAEERARFALCGSTRCVPTPLLPSDESHKGLARKIEEGTGDLEPPKKISGRPPGTTPLGRRAKITGVVILLAVVNEKGVVDDVWVVRGLPLDLTEETVTALKSWKFRPATERGEAVSVFYNFTTWFMLREP